jgi:thymidylate synthase
MAARIADYEYGWVINDILTYGEKKKGRNGNTYSLFAKSMTIYARDAFPIITSKKVAWKHAIKELLWHLSKDSSNVNALGSAKHLWEKWADKDGYLTSSYGRMWRKFPLPDKKIQGEQWALNEFVVWDEETKGYVFDQIAWLINEIKINPGSRRLVITAWHPANATVASIPPCQPAFTFNIQGEYLNCFVHARSQDCALGLPFDLIAYSALQQIICQLTGYKKGHLNLTMVDAHIYEEHLEDLAKQISRPKIDCVPELVIQPFNNIDELTLDHFDMLDYKSHEAIKYELKS